MSYFKLKEDIQSLNKGLNKAKKHSQEAQQAFQDAGNDLARFTEYYKLDNGKIVKKNLFTLKDKDIDNASNDDKVTEKDLLEYAKFHATDAKIILTELKKKLKKHKNSDDGKNLKLVADQLLDNVKEIINSLENTSYYDIRCCSCGIRFVKF